MGSRSDWSTMQHAADILTALDIEHEVRSLCHPMFGRFLVNRNPAINNRDYVRGHEALPV